jgi:hypothetical protein
VGTCSSETLADLQQTTLHYIIGAGILLKRYSFTLNKNTLYNFTNKQPGWLRKIGLLNAAFARKLKFQLLIKRILHIFSHNGKDASSRTMETRK